MTKNTIKRWQPGGDYLAELFTGIHNAPNYLQDGQAVMLHLADGGEKIIANHGDLQWIGKERDIWFFTPEITLKFEQYGYELHIRIKSFSKFSTKIKISPENKITRVVAKDTISKNLQNVLAALEMSAPFQDMDDAITANLHEKLEALGLDLIELNRTHSWSLSSLPSKNQTYFSPDDFHLVLFECDGQQFDLTEIYKLQTGETYEIARAINQGGFQNCIPILLKPAQNQLRHIHKGIQIVLNAPQNCQLQIPNTKDRESVCGNSQIERYASNGKPAIASLCQLQQGTTETIDQIYWIYFPNQPAYCAAIIPPSQLLEYQPINLLKLLERIGLWHHAADGWRQRRDFALARTAYQHARELLKHGSGKHIRQIIDELMFAEYQMNQELGIEDETISQKLERSQKILPPYICLEGSKQIPCGEQHPIRIKIDNPNEQPIQDVVLTIIGSTVSIYEKREFNTIESGTIGIRYWGVHLSVKGKHDLTLKLSFKDKDSNKYRFEYQDWLNVLNHRAKIQIVNDAGLVSMRLSEHDEIPDISIGGDAGAVIIRRLPPNEPSENQDIATIKRAVDDLSVQVSSLVRLSNTIQSDLIHLQNHAELPQKILTEIDRLLKAVESEPKPETKIKMTLPLLLNFIEWEIECKLPDKPFQQLWQKIKRVCLAPLPSP